MSKAFTRETDAPDDDDDVEDAQPLPKGSKNYMTPPGFQRMQEELRHLLRVERPKVVEVVSWAAGNGDRSENGDYLYGKKRLREIDRRIRYLNKRLESATVVDPADQKNRDQIFFGATVTYAREDGAENTIKIVGADEVDLDRGHVSWVSPIARALLKARKGDLVDLRTPAGVEQIEVLDIRYDVG
ncbi:transcription elongation factor GreB [Azospirillum thermophilum]|uniref:Transcription elongation factor GreB n=1 Tax=Azospirillum thermophilum TaxID=2202148 RepID=A0A2S2CPW5_9PROT|nr:transcription elongation factor GreB [Azospirillum thermophilum]AWK86541.1 transcription elongation factor GreB [Azospirillum thermophilum]